MIMCMIGTPHQILLGMIKSRRIRRTKKITYMWEKKNATEVLVGKHERKRPLGKPTQRWQNIKMNLTK